MAGVAKKTARSAGQRLSGLGQSAEFSACWYLRLSATRSSGIKKVRFDQFAGLQADAWEPFPDFSHDLVNLKRLQTGRFLF